MRQPTTTSEFYWIREETDGSREGRGKMEEAGAYPGPELRFELRSGLYGVPSIFGSEQIEQSGSKIKI